MEPFCACSVAPMGNWRVLIVLGVAAGCVVAAGWLAGTTSGSSQWVPPGAVSVALRQAGVQVRIARPVGASWASTNQLYRGSGVRVAWYFAGTTGSRGSVIGPMYSNELGGSRSSQGVQVIEVASAASAARYVSRIRPALARPVGVLGVSTPRVCSYRNLVVAVAGLSPAATEVTLGRVARALENTAPRLGTTATTGGACNEADRLHF